MGGCCSAGRDAQGVCCHGRRVLARVPIVHALAFRLSYARGSQRRPPIAIARAAGERNESTTNTAAPHEASRKDQLPVISANEALERLRDGNRRFVDGERSVDTMIQARRIDFGVRQEPLAVILGCSDSRVPVEVVFDQGFGDLFVIRVAGNIVAPSQIGSVEFAAERLATRLVVVLGHTRCGAVQATLEDLQQKQSQSWNMNSIVSRIRPSVEGLLSTDLKHDHAALVTHAVRANVRASVNQLRHGSDVLERLSRVDGLQIVGAEYSLDTGVVDFFDGP
jgi:carbonic anhydrase